MSNQICINCSKAFFTSNPNNVICYDCLPQIDECDLEDLLPPLALAEVQKCLQRGAEKHSPWGWQENTDEIDILALSRHMNAYYFDNVIIDPESKCQTLAHAICRLMFILDRKLEEDK